MTSKPETIAQLRRKIERLEAQIAILRESREADYNASRSLIIRAVDAETRIKQAMRILTGQDEA